MADSVQQRRADAAASLRRSMQSVLMQQFNAKDLLRLSTANTEGLGGASSSMMAAAGGPPVSLVSPRHPSRGGAAPACTTISEESNSNLSG
jgi:hypothetical protein